MAGRLPDALTVVATVLPCVSVAACTLLCAGTPLAAEGRDRRSTEVLRYGCASEFGRREVTLFANGTVRLREGAWEAQRLYLEELSPEAVDENVRVLSGVYSDREVDRIRQPMGGGLAGNWIERCEIHLELPTVREVFHYEFTAQDVVPLAVSRMIHVAEELALLVQPLQQADRVPKDYEPKFGDVLRTAEGDRYRVLRRTVDGSGVELEGIGQPVRIYVALEELGRMFVALESAADDRMWWAR